MDSWEDENDIISKLLKQSSYDKHRSSGLVKEMPKSLHEELTEIGECLHESIVDGSQELSTKPFNLQSLMGEFESLNEIIERKLSQSSCCSESSSQLGESNKNNSQSGKSSKNNSQSGESNENDIQTGGSCQPAVRAPPGFENRIPNRSFDLNSLLKEVTTGTKKLFEGKIETRQSHIAVPEIKESKQKKCKQHVEEKPPFCNPFNKTAKDFLSEFNKLSSVMDTELSCYTSNVQIMREQKQFASEQIKTQGKVEILTSLLQQQKVKARRMTNEYKNKLLATEKKYTEEIKRLKVSTREHRTTTSALQMEFNKVINERESEIESLYAQVNDLQGKLDGYEGGTDEIAMENEELLEMVQIKDKYIASLRLQNTNHQKMNVQYEWKLGQADDLLEMVENERDKIEAAAKSTEEIITQLRKELKTERKNNSKLMEEMNMKRKKEFTETGKNDMETETREKLKKIAHRSSSGRRSCIIKCDGDDDVPVVLKSLGWSTPSRKKH